MNLSVLIYTRQAWQVPIGLGLPTVTQAQLCKYISHNSTYNPQQTSVTCRNVDTVFLTGNCYREKWKMTDGKCLKEEKLKPKIQKQKQKTYKNSNNKNQKKIIQNKTKQNKTKLNKFLTPIIMIMLNKQIYNEKKKKNTFQTFLESAGLSQQPMSAEQTYLRQEITRP